MYENDFSAVRPLGLSEARARRSEYAVDLVTNSLDIVLLSQLWVPGVDWFRNGYIAVEAQVSASASASVIVAVWITIGGSRVANVALGNSSPNRPSSCTISGKSPPLYSFGEGTQDVQLHLGVNPSPAPGSCTLSAISLPVWNNAYMDVRFIVDPLIVAP